MMTTHARRLVGGSTLLFFTILLIGLPGCTTTVKRPLLTKEKLSTFGSVTATIEGSPRVTYMNGDSCHYSEWAHGPFNRDGTGRFEADYQSTDTVLIVTDYGVMPIDVFSLRLFLRPVFSSTFSPENAKNAALPVQRLVEKSGDIIAVREWALVPNQTYHVRIRHDSIAAEGLSLATGDPVIVTRPVIEISDRPFEIVRELGATPSTRREE